MIATEGARNVIDLSQPHRPHRSALTVSPPDWGGNNLPPGAVR
jgi:hypothetical protein